jgi:hypothetical protein
MIAAGWFISGGLHREQVFSASTPEEAVQSVLAEVKAHNWNQAYSYLADTADVDEADFVRDLEGTDGSLRSYSSLDGYDVWPLRKKGDEAVMRARLRWSTAVGPLDDVRDLDVERRGSIWKVVWPVVKTQRVPPQVIPVNYLRWDVINRGAQDDWGEQNVDSPNVRIVSMNAVERGNEVVILGEIVNEDTVPAYVNVNAVLQDENKNPIAEEGSFDNIAHTLLPRQVSPYRIDFPGMKLSQVKSVRMDAKALLVPASADPVIAVTNQKLEKDPALGKEVLHGQLVNESGEVVNIAQVLAAYYDSNGKVVWVSNGYVDQALLPNTPVGFGVDIPDDIAARVQNYRVTVNHYTIGQS